MEIDTFRNTTESVVDCATGPSLKYVHHQLVEGTSPQIKNLCEPVWNSESRETKFSFIACLSAAR